MQFALVNVHVSYGSSIHTRRQQVAELLRLLTTAAADGAGSAVGVSPQGRLWHDKQARRCHGKRLYPASHCGKPQRRAGRRHTRRSGRAHGWRSAQRLGSSAGPSLERAGLDSKYGR